MFGGAGLFADGVMFSLVSGGQIYLKADATTVTWFEHDCCGPFEYSTKHSKRALTSIGGCPTGSMTTPTSSRNGLGMHSRPRTRLRRQSRGSERSG
jgi:DNA transformation protein